MIKKGENFIFSFINRLLAMINRLKVRQLVRQSALPASLSRSLRGWSRLNLQRSDGLLRNARFLYPLEIQRSGIISSMIGAMPCRIVTMVSSDKNKVILTTDVI